MIPKHPMHIYRRGPYLDGVARGLGLLLVGLILLAVLYATIGAESHGKGPVTAPPSDVVQPGGHRKGK